MKVLSSTSHLLDMGKPKIPHNRTRYGKTFEAGKGGLKEKVSPYASNDDGLMTEASQLLNNEVNEAKQQKVINAKKDAEYGNKRVNHLRQYLPGFDHWSEGRISDLINKEGMKLEIKSERYLLFPNERYQSGLRKTPNLFVETYSHHDDNNPSNSSIGGVFQANKNGSDYIIHLFENNQAVVIKCSNFIKKYPNPNFFEEESRNAGKRLWTGDNWIKFTGKEGQMWKTQGYPHSVQQLVLEGIAQIVDLDKEPDLTKFLKKD